LVIAPILGNGHSDTAAVASCCADHSKTEMVYGTGKCDPEKMANMTKDACEAICKENGCTPEQTAKCLANFDANGKYKYQKTDCFDTSKYEKKTVNVSISSTNGNTVGKVTKIVNDKTTTEVFEGTEAEVQAKIDAVK
jgi:K(+)-stimulated pyrophosphate-energized sodium pump